MRKRQKIAGVMAVVFVLLLSLVVLPVGAQQVHRVTPGESVQDAIDNADPGDLILLEAGSHEEYILVDKPLTIRGEGNAILEGEGADHIITITAPAVAVEEITITGLGSNKDGIHVDYKEISDYLVANPGTDNILSVSGVTLNGGDLGRGGIRISGSGPVDIDAAEINFAGNQIFGFVDGIDFHNEIGNIDGSVIYIAENVITVNYFAIDFDNDSISDSNVYILNNDIATDSDHSIAFSALKEGTDVRIENNEVAALDNQSDSLFFGGNVEESEVAISGNRIISEDSDGIYFWSVSDSRITITDNYVSGYDDGIYLHQIYHCDVVIDGNEMYGDTVINFRVYEGSTMQITGNSLSTATYAIHAQVQDGAGAPVRLYMKGNRFFDNTCGVDLREVNLSNPGSGLWITDNSFRDNDTAIRVRSYNILEGVSFVSSGNSFTGSVDYGILNETGEIYPAHLNWWGAADGPTNSPGSGDPVSSGVAFDPWLALLELDRQNVEKAAGDDVNLTGLLLNSDDQAADLELWVRFSVSGANNFTDQVPLSGGGATLSYSGSVAGSDVIVAEVLFAGEATGMRAEARVEWTAADEEDSDGQPAELPRTGAGGFTGFAAGLLLAISGFVFYRRRKTRAA